MGIFVKHFDGPFWTIQATYYSPKLQYTIKNIPGVLWDPDKKRGVGYVDAIDALIRRLTEQHGITVNRGDLPKEARTQHLLPVAEKDTREYQKRSIDFAIANGKDGCILALGMGLGKTLCGVRVIRAYRMKGVVVCPSYVKGVWADEFAKWWPAAKVAVLKGVKDVQPIEDDLDAVILNYDIAHAWVEALKEWGGRVLIADECHYLQNEGSRRTNAVRTMRGHLKKDTPSPEMIPGFLTVAVGLSGTPMTNRPRDLYAVINTLSPGRMGQDRWRYEKEFCNGHKEEIEVKEE